MENEKNILFQENDYAVCLKNTPIWCFFFFFFFFGGGTRVHSYQARPKGGGGGGGCVGCDRTPFWMWFLFIYYIFFACVLVIEVGDVRRYPYPVSGKLTKIFLRRKKKVSESRSSAFSGLARLSRLAADLVQNPHPRFQKASYGPDS